MLSGMTKEGVERKVEKTSISLPAYLAAYARSKENTSAYVADLIAADQRRTNVHELLEQQGYVDRLAVTPAGCAAMGDRLAALEAARRRSSTRQAA